MLTAVQNISYRDSSAKASHCCISMTTVNTVLVTETSTPTAVKTERIDVFPWHQ
jgi:hypothetical protein